MPTQPPHCDMLHLCMRTQQQVIITAAQWSQFSRSDSPAVTRQSNANSSNGSSSNSSNSGLAAYHKPCGRALHGALHNLLTAAAADGGSYSRSNAKRAKWRTPGQLNPEVPAFKYVREHLQHAECYFRVCSMCSVCTQYAIASF